MKPFISRSLYGFLNYSIALLLLVSPWLFKFSHVTIAAGLLMPLLMGWLQLIMSIFSDNPLGFNKLKVFPMQMQNFVDVLMGSFLLALPWTYAFSGQVFLPHFILGLALLLKGIFAVESPFLTRPHRTLPEGGISSTDSLEGRLNH
ncbi:hypothetical protein FO440_06925 [Mucilaginibacter corticis]|uniref:SPW repeat-containing integral membrane domain-containing protein n=1 Tax=Mucilaginibacter corticis TaxID=2597670 RepID=A0A556MVM0_9SPHI|nr:hypothetical protein [Mucilaginibacter corticis]TSJ43912.1 hypothetical protein FO440_06925 [Mucilaginibacter corticis]